MASKQNHDKATMSGECRLLALPAELRLRIYEEALTAALSEPFHYDHVLIAALSESTRYQSRLKSIITLLCTCRQIYDEAKQQRLALLEQYIHKIDLQASNLTIVLEKNFIPMKLGDLSSNPDVLLVEHEFDRDFKICCDQYVGKTEIAKRLYERMLHRRFDALQGRKTFATALHSTIDHGYYKVLK
jgi:hypothetical protein